MQNVRGMQDVWGKEAEKFNFIVENARKISKNYGFFECITPVVEFANIFERNLGSESDVVKKEIYKFQDRGGESLALRPEFTAGIVRAFLQNNFSSARIFSVGPLFRYDRPQKGRHRQFNQVNFESFSRGGFFEDAEIVLLAYNFLTSIGLSNQFTLEVNSLGSKTTLVNYSNALSLFFEERKDELSKISQERLLKNPLRILDSKESIDIEICKNAPKIDSFYTPDEYLEFSKTLDILKHLNIPFKINLGIVRGLDYYTGIVFEFTTELLGAQSTILGGGRYDSLVKDMGGKETKAIGFAAGIERLSMLIPDRQTKEKALFLIPLKEENFIYSMNVAETVRSYGIKTFCICDNTNVGKRLEKVSKEPYEGFAIVIGSNEELSGTFKLKDLTQSKEIDGNINTIISCLK